MAAHARREDLINLVVRAEVDQQQNVRAGFRVLLFGKDNPAVVSHGTGVQADQLAAQVVGFQARVGKVFRHAPQGGFNLRLQRGIFPREPMERALEFRRENEFAHGSFAVAQAGYDAFGGLRLELAGAQGFNGFLRRRRRFAPPRLDAPLAQEAFEHFLFVGRQRLGVCQNTV